MGTTDLTLKLPDKTFKKLRALAMLSGSTVPQLEGELLGYFDEMLSTNIAALLEQMDGKKVIHWKTSEEPAPDKEPEPEPEAPADEDANSHSLSADDDAGENKSLEEQVEDEQMKFDIDVPDVGGDSDRFLDVSLAPKEKSEAPRSPELPPDVSMLFGDSRTSKMRQSFDPRKPRASISDATDDN